MGKAKRQRDRRGSSAGNRDRTVSTSNETRDGARKNGPLFAAYMHVQAISGQVVLQAGTRNCRRTLMMTADNARGITEGMRRAAPIAAEQQPQLAATGFPDPRGVEEDEFFAHVNAWAQDLDWIADGAEINPLGGIGAAHGHVVHLNPMEGSPDRYSVTFFQPHDITSWLAAQLDHSAGQAAEMSSVYGMMPHGFGTSAAPRPSEILQRSQGTPWPPE